MPKTTKSCRRDGPDREDQICEGLHTCHVACGIGSWLATHLFRAVGPVPARWRGLRAWPADLRVFADPENGSSSANRRVRQLGEFDCVFMRKDPPFDAEYIYTTYILERAELQGALVANRPQGLRDMNEKVFTAWFPQCCAPTLISRSSSDITAFAAEHGKIVVKPLDGMGGKSIFVTEKGDKNMRAMSALRC